MTISAYYPANTSSGSVLKVADSAERLALTPVDGDLVIQLDSDTLYTYDGGTVTWVVLASAGGYVAKAGDTMSGNLLFASSTGIDTVVSGTTTLNIGVSNADVINLGNATCTINFIGSVNNNNVTNLVVTDKLITLNDGGAAASGTAVGMEVEEDGTATGYIKTSSDRTAWELKSPANAGVISLKTGTHNLVLDTSTVGASTKTYSALNASGVIALSAAALTVGSLPFVTTSGVLTEDTAIFSVNNTANQKGLGIGLATASVAARLHLSGAMTANSWTTNGIGFRIDASTYTNGSGSGTIAVQAAHAIGIPTFNSTSSVTVTDAAAYYIAGPAAGTGNTTVTRGWGLYQAAGFGYIAGGLRIGTTDQTSTIRLYSVMVGTNAAANAIYAGGTVNATSAGSYQSAALTGDASVTGSQNNTSSVGTVAVDGISRCSNTATATAIASFRSILTNTSTGIVTHAYGYRSVGVTNSGGGSVTNQYGQYVDDLTAATNNYASYLNISSGSNKWNVYANGTASNYMSGTLSIGTTTNSAAKVHVISTTEQARIGYDASNYYSTTVSSAGLVTLAATGSSAGFSFSSRVIIPTATPASASATGTTGHIAWDSSFLYVCTATDTWKRVAIATW